MKFISMRFKDMLKRREFVLALTISTAIFMIPAIMDLFLLYGKEISSIRSAWYYFSMSLTPSSTYFSRPIVSYAFLLIIPLLSCMSYSYCFLDESKCRIKNILIVTVGRAHYYISSAIVVFLGGFLIIFVPMLLSQLVFIVGVPITSNVPIDLSVPAYLDEAFSNILYFKNIANNYHYLYNFIYCFIPSFVFALIGLLSYSFSLIVKKNKYLIITLPFIIYLVLDFVLETYNKLNWTISHIITPSYSIPGMTISHLIIIVLSLLFINILLITSKIKFQKDEL